jgi:hypothetical protein
MSPLSNGSSGGGASEDRPLDHVLAVPIVLMGHDFTCQKFSNGFAVRFVVRPEQRAPQATEIDVAEAYADISVLAFNAGELTPVDAAKGKWFVSELQKRVMDRCLQLHGGYSYMTEYPVARAFLDTRVQTIYGGTTEIMKEIVGRDIAG